VLKKVAQRLSVIQWLALAAAAMLVSTALLSLQLFWERPWSRAKSSIPGSRSSWIEPIEVNPPLALPEIIGNINAVAIQPNSPRVWIAGDRGLLAYSDDAGNTWTKLEYDASAGTFSVAGSQGSNSPKSLMFGVPFRVEAATVATYDGKKPPDGPPTQQSAPPQQTNAPNTDAKPQSIPNEQNRSPVQQSPIQQSPPPAESKPTASSTSQVKMVDVPSVQGQALALAEKTLVSIGLRLGVVRDGYSVSEIGNVIAQTPNLGERVPLDTPINLTIGAKNPSPQPRQVPNVVVPPNNSGGAAPKQPGPVPGPAVVGSLANWPAPNLLAIAVRNGTATIHASDGRVFTSSDAGEHWTGELLTAALFSPDILRVSEPRAFNYRYFVPAVGAAPQVTRERPVNIYPLNSLTYSGAAGVTRSVWFSNEQDGCAVGSDTTGGMIRCTQNRGLNWPFLQRTREDHLEDVIFADDGKTGWVVGANGVVLWTGDGGEHWSPKTLSAAVDMGASRPRGDWWKFLPLWFYLAWTFGLFCAAVAPLARIEETPVKFIQDYAASDRPLERGDRDALDFTPLAKSLSAFVRNAATKPPLTISIDGPWGSGKSSLMNLMCSDLREFGFRAVWFNAWHNQKEEHLLAALLQTVRLEAVPQLWDPSGVGFRIRLIINRLKRYWFPMLLVVGLGVLLFFLDRLHVQSSGHSLLADLPRLLPTGFGGTGKDSGSLFARLNQWPILGGLMGLIAIWPVMRKLLEAFGTNPAALLATISKGNRIADLDAQTSFRDKFAKEFRDVTRALGDDQQLVVFIDDLDRCRPENVRDVLEAVNFLVSSGECFVVMGLERKSVGAAVGLSLKDIALEMADEKEAKPPEEEVDQVAGNDTKPPAESGHQVPGNDEKDGVMARRKYASQFLDKLINLEIPIPELDQSKARGLFYEETKTGADLEAILHRRKRAKRAEQWALYAGGAIRFAFGFVVIASLVAAGYFGGVRIEGDLKQPTSAVKPPESRVLLAVQSGNVALQVVDTNSTAAPAANKGNAVAVNAAAAKADALGTPGAPGASAGIKPEIHPGSNPRPDPWKLWWPEVGAAALLAMIAYYTLEVSGKGARHDSEKFVEALSIWYPLVIKRQSTPRAVKRWMNRVRYLATRELPSSELRSPMERFVDWYSKLDEEAVAPGGKKGATETDQKPTPRIPEEIVVALAAIYELDPAVLESEEQFRSLQTVASTSGISLLGDAKIRESVNQLISERRALHIEKMTLDSWNQIATYAPRFRNLWPNIKIQ
jgi:hypothetical protein